MGFKWILDICFLLVWFRLCEFFQPPQIANFQISKKALVLRKLSGEKLIFDFIYFVLLIFTFNTTIVDILVL